MMITEKGKTLVGHQQLQKGSRGGEGASGRDEIPPALCTHGKNALASSAEHTGDRVMRISGSQSTEISLLKFPLL